MNKGNQKEYVEPKLYTCKGDLSKRWYIEFSAYDEISKDLKKKRITCPAKYTSEKQRRIWGKENIKKITSLLEKGFHFKASTIESKQDHFKNTDLVHSLQIVLNISQSTLEPKTVVTYQSAINKFRLYASEIRIEISDLKKKDVILFRDHLLEKNSPRTANNTIQHLTALFSRIQERTSIKENPFKVKRVKEPTTLANIAFTAEDQRTIENYLIKNDPQVYFFTRFLYFSFIRPGELNKLKVKDINQNYISVHGLISKNGKTETAQIIPDFHNIIQKMDLVTYSPELFVFGKNLIPSHLETGKQVAFRRHQKALQFLELDTKGYTLYSWKHTGAVNAYLAGVGLKELQSMLRHSSIQITDIYLKSLGLRTDPNLKHYTW